MLKRAGLSVESVERYLSKKHGGDENFAEHEDALFAGSTSEALKKAEDEAARFHHSILGVEHLLLALLAEQHGEAADLFAAMRVDCEQMKAMVSRELT